MNEPEAPPIGPGSETVGSRGVGLRVLASVIALAAGTAALVVAIVLVTGVLS